MFYSCDPEHKETIEPEKLSIENPEEPERPESPDEPEISSTNTIINLNNEFMIVGNKTWSSVAYGNGMFVVGGADGYVTTSTDEGKTWSTPKQLITAGGSWRNVIYANGSFMMLNFHDGKLATSTDGTIWTIQDTYSLGYWRGLAYGNGIYVAVGPNNGIMMTSPDGKTWTKRTVDSVIWGDIAYGNGIFIAITGNYFTTSTDGITWTNPKKISNAYRGYEVITFGNGKFVVAEGYEGNTQTTTDGVTWTVPNTSSGSHNWLDIAASNGKFILVGNNGYIATSTDGITWAPTQIKDEAGSPVTLILSSVCATQ